MLRNVESAKPEQLTPNKYLLEALTELKEHGLTAQHFHNWPKACPTAFNYGHQKALIDLVLKQNWSVEKALNAMQGLMPWQASGLAEGLSRDETLALNRSEAIAFAKFRHLGLTVADFKSFNENQFGTFHITILDKLITERNYSAQDALTCVGNLDWKTAKAIAMKIEKGGAPAQYLFPALNKFGVFMQPNTPKQDNPLLTLTPLQESLISRFVGF